MNEVGGEMRVVGRKCYVRVGKSEAPGCAGCLTEVRAGSQRGGLPHRGEGWLTDRRAGSQRGGLALALVMCLTCLS